MIKKLLLIMTICFNAIIANSQDIYSNLFHNDFSELNSAYVGFLESKQVLFYTSGYDNFNSDLNSSIGRMAINIPVSKIHSGFGIHTSYSKYYIFSDLDFGVIYSFKYKITDNIKVSLGTNFSIFRRGAKGTVINYDSGYGFYDIDESVYLYNLDMGFWINMYGFQIGLSNKHINEPSGKTRFLDTDTIKSRMNLILNYDFHIAQKHTFGNSLLILNLKDFFDRQYIIINNQFKINNKFIIGLSTEIYKSKDISTYISPNIGFNLSNKFNFIMSVNLIKINPMYYLRENKISAVLNYNF